MFKTDRGNLRVDAEALFETIKGMPDAEIAALEKRRGIMRNALNTLNAKLCNLPARERDAALSLLYKEFTDTVFDFHLSLETSAAREKISRATTREEKQEALREFRALGDHLALLYEFN